MTVFTLAGTQQAAVVRQIEAWVHAYLAAGPWANPGLSAGLRLERRWWRGPVALPVARLLRCCGPEPAMEFHVEPASWERRVGAIAVSLTSPAALPPLLVEYRAGTWSVRDGNHRLAAITRLGWPRAWAVIWYNSAADYEADGAQTLAEGTI
jgi:hypothetical protein